MAAPAIDHRPHPIDQESIADRILDQLDQGLPRGEIPAALFGNEEIYRRELRKIFARCWVFLGHESEIAARGDYVIRKIGEDNFILVHDDHGQIRVLFDACRHRGVSVCRADSGNTSHFRCPYHGWTYDNSGALVGAPLWRSALAGISKAERGLIPAARVDSYHGLLFASLDPSAPSLEEYLGDMAWYLDLVFGLNEHGVEILGEPQRVVLNVNWKSAAENFAGDDYHLGTLHRAGYAVGAFPVPFAQNMMGYHIQASPGHSLSLSMAESEDEPGPQFFGYPDEISRTFNTSRISEHQFRIAKRSRVFVGNIFPNFSILAAPMTEDAAHYPPTGMLTVRTWQPAGPDRIEMWNWFCAYRTMTEEQKERAYRAGVGTFSLGGMFEMDDSEPWISIARTGKSVAAEVMDLQLDYRMGLPGVGISQRVTDFPGPGVVYSPRHEEGVQRNLFWLYQQLMRAEPGQWPKLTFDD